MADAQVFSARPIDAVSRLLYSGARLLALIGGVAVCAMAVLTTVSILGRFFFAKPIPGDYEIVSVLSGTAVFAFLPYCQLMGGNIVVDFFMAAATPRAKFLCDLLGHLLYLALGALLTWRLVYGAFDMYHYAETTTTIGFPRWITFPFDILCMGMLIAVTVYTLVRSIAEVITGRSLTPILRKIE